MQKRIKPVGAIHESTVFRGSIVIDPYTPPFLSICAKRYAVDRGSQNRSLVGFGVLVVVVPYKTVKYRAI